MLDSKITLCATQMKETLAKAVKPAHQQRLTSSGPCDKKDIKTERVRSAGGNLLMITRDENSFHLARISVEYVSVPRGRNKYINNPPQQIVVSGNVNQPKELNNMSLRLAMTLFMASLLSQFHYLGCCCHLTQPLL